MKLASNNKVAIAIVVLLVVVVLSIYYSRDSSTTENMRNVDALSLEPKYSVIKEDVSYYQNSRGYLAKPATAGDYPGAVMIHEWWGLNDQIKEMAVNLAGQGYVVLAVDLYDGKVAQDSAVARELSASVRENPGNALENMRSAISYLKEEHDVEKIASLGWCFGGGQSLQISLNENIDATVIYYGNLVTDAENLSSINSPVLGIFGAEDTSIPVSSVNQFDSSLDSLGIENEIYIYPGVGHAFANPSGMNYAPEETEDAWLKTISFLDKHL